MEFALLGWADDDVQLELDYTRFSYAGKFVMTSTGKAVARVDDEIVAAVSFSPDRTDDATLWLRYLTVRDDHRGTGVGPRLVGYVVDRATDRDFERVRIAVNNPFAYHALYKAGFGYTGEETGLAELVLEWPGDRSTARYQAGLDRFRDRELADAEAAFLEARADADPPSPDEP